MGDESAAPEQRVLVELFNGSSQPLVPTGAVGWGGGVIMPGESFKTDNPEAYAADQPGSPWSTDLEATRALLSPVDPDSTIPPDSSQDGPSVAPSGLTGQDQALAPTDGRGVPVTHMLAGAETSPASPAANLVGANLVGDELVDAEGHVLGRIVPEPSPETATNQAADAAQPQQEV